jgi:hypothetical protein
MTGPGDTKRPDPLLYTGGQMNALLAFVSALIRTHPEPANLRAMFDRTSTLQETTALNAAVSEDYLKGQRDTIAAIDKLLEVVTAEAKNPPAKPAPR